MRLLPFATFSLAITKNSPSKFKLELKEALKKMPNNRRKLELFAITYQCISIFNCNLPSSDDEEFSLLRRK